MYVYENYEYCYIDMPEEKNKILKLNHAEKSIKVSFFIGGDAESLIHITKFAINPKHSSITKINLHNACS